MAQRITGITFDYWNTLCVPDVRYRSARHRAVVEAIGDAGFEVTEDQVEATVAVLFERFNAAWIANEQFTPRQAVLGIIDHLGIALDEAGEDRVAEAFFAAGQRGAPPLTPNVAATLEALAGLDIGIGIVCDVGFSTPSWGLREHLETHGVLKYFDHWSFSDEVGVYKPRREIFEHALDGLGCVPERCAHVGDLRRTDVAGSAAVGMVSVRYRGSHDDVDGDLPDADHVIDDHADLIGVLGLA